MTGVAQIRYLEASGPVKIPAELSSVLPGRIEAVPCKGRRLAHASGRLWPRLDHQIRGFPAPQLDGLTVRALLPLEDVLAILAPLLLRAQVGHGVPAPYTLSRPRWRRFACYLTPLRCVHLLSHGGFLLLAC